MTGIVRRPQKGGGGGLGAAPSCSESVFVFGAFPAMPTNTPTAAGYGSNGQGLPTLATCRSLPAMRLEESIRIIAVYEFTGPGGEEYGARPLVAVSRATRSSRRTAWQAGEVRPLSSSCLRFGYPFAKAWGHL